MPSTGQERSSHTRRSEAVYDPYGWYLMSTYSSADARRAAGHADLFFIVLLPIAAVVVCVVLAVWVHLWLREPKARNVGADLTRQERRRLAQLERRLRADDPELAR